MGNLLFHASDEEYWENIPQDKSRGKVKKTIMLENDIFCLTNSYRIIEKCSILFKFKEGENLALPLHFVQPQEYIEYFED